MPDRNVSFARLRRIAVVPVALSLLNLRLFAAPDSPDDGFARAEADTDRWIQLESQIASARTDWTTEKALLASNIKLLETEQATLQRAIESNRKASEVYVSNRNRLSDRVEEQSTALAELEMPLRSIEQSLRSLYPKLPPPLQQQLAGHLNKLAPAADGGAASVATRTQSIVSSLTAIERFSNTLTLVRETQPGPGSGEVSAQVLYWGLAVGYGVDQANGRAWIVEPGSSGWVWSEKPEIYDQVLTLIASYQRDAEDPQLVFLPATVQ